MTTPNTGTLVVGGFMAWAIFRRIRRNIGRQKLRPARIIFSIVAFTLASGLFLMFAAGQPPLLEGLAGGLVLGIGLGFVGLRLTRFETTVEGQHYYTPNTHIGIALSVLFLGRMFYRIWVMDQTTTYTPGHQQVFQSPLTLFIFGLVAGYYLVYYIGLFVHTHDRKPDVPPTLPPLPPVA